MEVLLRRGEILVVHSISVAAGRDARQLFVGEKHPYVCRPDEKKGRKERKEKGKGGRRVREGREERMEEEKGGWKERKVG